MTVDIELAPYLKMWIVAAMGGSVPVMFPKGSPYNNLLKVLLRHKRERDGITANTPGLETLKIIIPKFQGKDPDYYNYLPRKGQAALESLIRDAFDAELFAELCSFRNIGKRNAAIIEAWMDAKGIEMNDRNWNAVLKRVQILKARAYDRKRKKSNFTHDNA